MSKDYLPSREAELLIWMTTFQSLISAEPGDYGLSDEQASTFATAYNRFRNAYQTAHNPLTRSPGNVEIKNTTKKALIAETRRLVRVVQAWPQITDDKRAALGITVPDTDPSPVPVPSTAPAVSIASVQGRLLNVRLREEGSDRRGKPDDVGAAWLYTYVGETMPDFAQMSFRGQSRRTYTQVVMAQDVPVGATVWVSACWVSTSGKPGAVSLPVQTWTNHGAMQNNAA